MQLITVPRPEAVIFDFDGVIADTEPLHYEALRTVLRDHRIPIGWRDYVDRCMGLDDRDAFREAFRAGGRELDDRALSDLVASKSRVFREVIRRGVRPCAGAIDAIASLHTAGVPLAISSGALRCDIVPILVRLDLTACFHTIVAADDVRKSKPDPEPYARAFRRLHRRYPSVSTPDKSLAVEDTPAGIRSAKAVGLRVLAVEGSHPAHELAEADHLARSLAGVRFLSRESPPATAPVPPDAR